jgi:hypothetical protein
MGDITKENSLIHEIMTDDMFKKDPSDEEYHIPYLMLLGLLYCASNNEVKA